MALFCVGHIRPNPFRHIDRYPIKRAKVAALRESLRTTGFWDNVVARQLDGQVEIAYGHHRLVALKEEYGPDREIPLIIKELNDDAMIQVMARENMDEWGSSAVVEHETVKAVVQAYANGKIKLPALDLKVRVGQRRHAPGFVENKCPGGCPGACTGHPYTILSVAKYLGWTNKYKDENGKTQLGPQKKVIHAIWALELIEEGLLEDKNFDKLTTTEAAALVVETRRIRDESREEAAKATTKAKKAEEEARTAAVDVAQAKAAGKPEEAVEATKTMNKALRTAADQKQKAGAATRSGRERAHSVGTKLAEGLQEKEVTIKHVKRRARDLEEVAGKKPKKPTPQDIDICARRMAKKVGKYLEDGSEEVQVLERLVHHRKAIDAETRTGLISVLLDLSNRAAALATGLKRGG